MIQEPTILNGAQFSEDRKHRFVLWRFTYYDRPKILYVGLNPSTANANTDDPTIRRLKTLTHTNGYGGFYIVNLFSYITPYPSHLDATVLTNLKIIHSYKELCANIVLCWGNFEIAKVFGKELAEEFPDALCFGQNKNGSPKHPLYLPSTTKLIQFNKIKTYDR